MILGPYLLALFKTFHKRHSRYYIRTYSGLYIKTTLNIIPRGIQDDASRWYQEFKWGTLTILRCTWLYSRRYTHKKKTLKIITSGRYIRTLHEEHSWYCIKRYSGRYMIRMYLGCHIGTYSRWHQDCSRRHITTSSGHFMTPVLEVMRSGSIQKVTSGHLQDISSGNVCPHEDINVSRLLHVQRQAVLGLR